MQRISDIDLLLIGKTGNGKSALGNAILKRRAFKSKWNVSSVTTDVDQEVTEYKGKIIKVVDGPGVGDTRFDTVEAKTLVITAMEEAIALNTRGYHAFLLVVRFGERFTREDIEAIQFLKSVFGTDFVQRFCIIVMTHGDIFERLKEDNDVPDFTFPQWCKEQEGVFQTLLEECANRVVLFDNVTKDDSKRDQQIDELLEVVASLQNQGHRYTNEYFDQAQALREKAIVESKKPAIREESLQETSLILQQLEQIRTNLQGEEQISSLKSLLQRCDALVQSIQEEDKGTGALYDLVESVAATRQSVSEAISVLTTIAEERRVMDGRVQEMNREIRSHQQQMEELKALRDKDNAEKTKALQDMERRQKEQEERMKKEANVKDQEWQARFADEQRRQQAQMAELVAQQQRDEEERQRQWNEMERQRAEKEERMRNEARANEQKWRAQIAEEQRKVQEKQKQMEEQYRKQKEEEQRQRKKKKGGCTVL